ncbi:MAG: hypothetical protein LBS94_03690 [Prevotellaceae bacterium]|nr:hypothetical protein [Prevotellaceae bacterium]
MKYISTLLLLSLSFGAFAQPDTSPRSRLRLQLAAELGGGLATLRYDAGKASHHNGAGGTVGAACYLFLSPQLALKTGLALQLYTAEATAAGRTADGTTSAQTALGEAFRFTYEYTGYRERSQALTLTIPLMLQLESEGELAFCAALGGKLAVPLAGSVRTTANRLLTTGYFELPNVTFEGDLPDYGFVDRSEDASHSYSPQLALLLSAEAGLKFRLSGQRCYAGFYFDYGVNSITAGSANAELVGYRSDAPATFAYGSYLENAKSVKLMGAGVLVRWFWR